MKTVTVDYENSAHEWWEAAILAQRQTPNDVPDTFRQLIRGNSTTVTDDEATKLLEWAQGLPGWDGGPEYAPHPLVVSDD